MVWIVYQKSTGNHDKNTAGLARGLSVKGRNLVLNLLEGKVLPTYNKHPSRTQSHILSRDEPTVNFSTIPETPWTDDVSKVSMECSRCMNPSHHRQLFPQPFNCMNQAITHVETSETTPIRIEGLVVEFDELLCNSHLG